MQAAQPLLEQLQDTGRQLVPVVQYVNLYRSSAVTTLANLSAATQAVDAQGRHYLRTVIPVTSEAIGGQAKRYGTNRHNPYPAPGEIADVAGGKGLSSSDCRNADNLTPVTIGTGAPPCRGPKLKTLNGRTSYYPNLVATAP